ncbi:hypothetical protein ACFQ0M_23025 [Kitasatospora aburaviensis]
MHRAGVVHQQRGGDQCPVRDLPPVQQRELGPGVGEQRVGQLLVGQPVEGAAGQVLVGDQCAVAAELRGGGDPAGADAGRDGRVRDQCLVLQPGAQRAQRPGCGAVRSRIRRQARWNRAAVTACRSSSWTSRSGRPASWVTR